MLYCSSPADGLAAWAKAHPTWLCEQVSLRFDFTKGEISSSV
ncbi:MAG: hypothetical protein ACYS67_10515 [Planctomycetota bacterium]